jgi:D-glycero-D-manno-heptose 1,7-bisphosphate phosphatase
MKIDKRIVFIDRDGVINECPGVGKYVTGVAQMKLFPFVKAALRKLKEHGFLVYVISNQGCVGKGMLSEAGLRDITSYMFSVLEDDRRLIDGVYYCVHRSEDRCPCRKPASGMIDEVFQRLDVDRDKLPHKPFFIGDTLRDIETARNAGIRGLLVFSGREKPEEESSWPVKPDRTAADLAAAVDLIVNEIEQTAVTK